MATIREVAQHAGVSVGTVSKVLNGSDDRVDPVSRERILASIRLLRYKPPPFEKNQKAAISHNLGMIVPDLFEHPLLRHGYAHLLLDGVLEQSAFRGWSVTIFANTMWDDVGNAVRRKYDGRCDGLIVVAPQPIHDIVPSLHRRGAPVVQIGTTAWLDDVSSIDIDNFVAGQIMARHFMELGHRRLGFVAHYQDQVSSRERYEGFLSVGGSWVTKYVVGPDDGIHAFADEFAQLGPNRPTALFAWHDGLALPVLTALQDLGLRVPEDVSIAGVDNSFDAKDLGISLTTIDNPLHRIGKAAAAMAIDRVLEHSLPREIIKLTPVLLVGATSGPPSN